MNVQATIDHSTDTLSWPGVITTQMTTLLTTSCILRGFPGGYD